MEWPYLTALQFEQTANFGLVSAKEARRLPWRFFDSLRFGSGVMSFWPRPESIWCDSLYCNFFELFLQEWKFGKVFVYIFGNV